MPDSPIQRPLLLRSGAFRLAALQAAISAVIVLALFGVTWWSVGAYVEQRVHTTTTDKLKGAVRLLNAGQLATLNRDQLDLDTDQYFGLFDANGQFLGGEIPALPLKEGDVSLRLRAALVGSRLLHVAVETLDDGRRVVVGMDRRRADALMARLRQAFFAAGFTGLAVAVVAAFVTTRRYLRRVDNIALVAAQIADGQIGMRVPVSTRQDEIDRLSVALNTTWQHGEQLLEGMRQLSTDVAHELRTPLAHLRFRLEQDRAAIDADNPACHALDRSIADVDRVLAVFGALLRISQIQSRQRRAGFEKLDLSQLAGGVIADYRPLFEDEKRSLRADIQPGISVVSDRPLLVQLLVNLIENVLKHTPAGVPLTVRLARKAGTTQLSVEDGGPGIPASQHERVLQRFVRLDASRSVPGTGLGLALVKAISDLHEAPLLLEDTRPGLRVTISFPRGA